MLIQMPRTLVTLAISTLVKPSVMYNGLAITPVRKSGRRYSATSSSIAASHQPKRRPRSVSGSTKLVFREKPRRSRDVSRSGRRGERMPATTPTSISTAMQA